MKLDEVMADVSLQLKQQSELGVQINVQREIPDMGPSHRGLWLKIPQVTAVFADLKRSTGLNANYGPQVAACAYTYFDRAMTVILERFSAAYIDVQGDGIFGLFSGKGSIFLAAAAARTMLTATKQEVATRFKNDASSDWDLVAGIGIDHGTLLVRRLGLRGARENEVWAGNLVNMAAKLSSVAGSNEMAVSERVLAQYSKASRLRQQALLKSCGCNGRTRGRGFDGLSGQRSNLWRKEQAPDDLGLDFDFVHKLSTPWCKAHGPEFCEAIITGQRPNR